VMYYGKVKDNGQNLYSYYAPTENGGLGVKNNYVQYLIFKYSALLKGFQVPDIAYFVRNLSLIASRFFSIWQFG